MGNPAISIVMPVYMAEHYLQRSISSILNQSFHDWEAIMVDDGSPDGSGHILDEYAKQDTRIRVIHKSNGGVSSARQVGIENAIGDYIIHFDPDDWATPNMLKELYHTVSRDNADMVICDFIWDAPTGCSISIQRPSAYDKNSLLKDLFVGRIHGSCCNKLVRRSIIESNRLSFPKELSIHEDLFFLTQLLLLNIKVSYLDQAYYHYVIGENPNSISQYIGQSYEYDVMTLNMFDKLLEGNESQKYAHQLFASKVIVKEFYRKESSSAQFIKKCIPFMSSIPSIKSKRLMIGCLLSMMGFYGFIKNFL